MTTNRLLNYTDHGLLLLLNQGDKEAFEEIYARYKFELIEAAYKQVQSLEVAKDIVQEVFLNLFLRHKKLRITHSLKAYLYTAIKYRVLNHKRSEKVKADYRVRMVGKNSRQAEDPYKILFLKELDNEINDAVAALPKKCKAAYALSRERDFSNKEIAIALDISVSTVEKHISKALRLIRSDIQPL